MLAEAEAPRPAAGDALARDVWLSQVMGRPVWRLRSGGVCDPAEILAGVDPPAMIETRVPVDAVDAVVRGVALARAGFTHVDTSITLECARLPECVAPASAPVPVRAAEPSDRAGVVDLARRSFSCSRFHRDPALPGAMADGIKAAWAGNYFDGGRGDALVVAEDRDHIAGFLLALVIPGEALVIDLVATDAAMRGRGVAGAMTAFARRMFPEPSVIRVGTQLANRAALRAYGRLGFVFSEAAHVHHCHLRRP